MFDTTGLARIQRFVKQPSISADGTGITEMAALLQEEIRDLSGSSRLFKTNGHPVVYGEINAGAAKTLLVYGMYDVQPVEGESWMVPPFSAEIVDLPDVGRSVVSRGAYNTKGPLAGFFNALHAAQRTGPLPINIKFLIEGEEEMQSKHLKDVVRANHDLLKADYAYFPFYSEDPQGKPMVFLGVKGILFFELVAKGGDHGGPVGRDIHGSNAVWFHNPAWDLIQALSSMMSRDQKHILIDGFYDDVDPPSSEDEALLAALGKTFTAQTELDTQAVKRFKYALEGVPLLKKYLYQPTLNIDGLVSGHYGAGTKTVIPHEARAKMDIRMVPAMQPERVIRLVRDHLDRHGFEHIDMEVNDSYSWAKTPASNPAAQAMIHAMQALGTDPEVWPHLAGSAPFYLFTKELGLPLAEGGLGHGGRPHSPDEYATVGGMKRFEASVLHFLYNLGGA
ncbi:MAG: M20/M25/M40 family metallo-hydrolase [Deinococcota bacterium]|nr:M20/M25/M40 family metallo-hydrolase [Deinococcota bacterium]